jgi:subtilisin family serine protease
VSVAGSEATDPESMTHGTAMAETLLRALAKVSTDADGTVVRILPVDVYGGRDATSTFDVLNGLLVAAREGAQIVNLSLGGGERMPILEQTIQSLKNQGILIVAAAGNDPAASIVYPAAYRDVLAVTAGDRQGNVAPYASRGEYVDLVAPGTSLVQLQQRSFLYTGTSSAAAHISGVAAGYLSQGGATPAAVQSLLLKQYGYQPEDIVTGP